MATKKMLKLHWKLFLPMVGMLWLIIGISIAYTVVHEHARQEENLENRLRNVNATVLQAVEMGMDVQRTVNFIHLFTDNTTLDPLRLTVYDEAGNMLADNDAPTIFLTNADGTPIEELAKLENTGKVTTIRNAAIDNKECMFNVLTSPDGKVRSFAALPYDDTVVSFLTVDPMVWILVIFLGVLSSFMAYYAAKAVCRDVYNLQDVAQAIAENHMPDEESMHFSKDELGEVSRRLIREYKARIQAVEEVANFERQIRRNVNHELKTPVGIVKGYLETVITDKDMPEMLRQNFLERALQHVDRLVTLINDISEITKMESGASLSETTELNFHEVVEQLARDIKVGHIADGMNFSYDIPEDCMVMGHKSLLINSLLNLVYNAAKYSEGTEIKLRLLGEKDGMYVFSFSDNGVGVSEEHLPRLFDLFYRVDTGRARKSGGTGLGLPIVRKAITSIGGEITVANAATGGLEFTFTLKAA